MDLTTLTSREIQDLITFYSFERRKVEYQLSKIDESLTELRAKLGIKPVTTTLEQPVSTAVEPATIILEVEETKEEIKIPEAKKEEEITETIIEEAKKEEKVVKPKKGRGRPRKNKQPEAEQKTVVKKEEIKSKKELGKNKKRKLKFSKEKKRIPLAPRLKYSKELKEREQRIAAETVKKSQAEKADVKEDEELFLSDLDNLILETIRIKSRLVNRYEFDEIVKNWAKAQHMNATKDQLYRKISKSLYRLTSAKYSLIRKYRVEGGPRLFAYGDANWFFKKTGKIKKQYQDKLAH